MNPSPTKLQFSYDRDADVLYISIGSPRPAVSKEDGEGLLIRRDPDSGEVVGLTVLDYAEHFRALPDLSWLAQLGLPEELSKFLRERPIVT
jgi:uncharacterized protein YuzE